MTHSNARRIRAHDGSPKASDAIHYTYEGPLGDAVSAVLKVADLQLSIRQSDGDNEAWTLLNHDRVITRFSTAAAAREAMHQISKAVTRRSRGWLGPGFKGVATGAALSLVVLVLYGYSIKPPTRGDVAGSGAPAAPLSAPLASTTTPDWMR